MSNQKYQKYRKSLIKNKVVYKKKHKKTNINLKSKKVQYENKNRYKRPQTIQKTDDDGQLKEKLQLNYQNIK